MTKVDCGDIIINHVVIVILQHFDNNPYLWIFLR